MLDKIKNVPNKKLLDVAILKQGNLPLIIYGAGSYAHDVAKFLAGQGISLNGACVDAEHFPMPIASFRDMPILSLDKVRQRYERFNLLIGFNDYRAARKKTKHIQGIEDIFFIDAPHHLYFFDYDYIVENKSHFEESYNYLSDEISRQTFIAYINSKISGQPDDLYDLRDTGVYFNSLVDLGSNEVFVDCGAYDGDTILQFHKAVGGKYEKIIAFECDGRNYLKLQKTISSNHLDRVQVINKGVWTHEDTLYFNESGTATSTISGQGEVSIAVDSIDHLLEGARVTFIKMDIEGAELAALKGAEGILKRERPKLAICVYHKPEDLITIPQYLKSLVPEYRFYLRHHQYISWETVLYAVPV
jgi:FkbM family methyltransferase